MSNPVDRSDDSTDYVSMHHRIQRSIRRRLKHLSAEIEKPVTDIVNEAITAYLDRLEDPTLEGTVLTKAELVEIASSLGIKADKRMSGDHILTAIRAELARSR